MERAEERQPGAGSAGSSGGGTFGGAACPPPSPASPDIVGDDSASGTNRKRRVRELHWSKREQEVVLVPNSSFRQNVKECWPWSTGRPAQTCFFAR